MRAASAARGPTVTVLARDVGGEHVLRLGGGDAQALALADREVVGAAVAAELAPGAVDDRARAVADAAVAGEERGLAGAGEEAEVLGLALVGHGQPRRAGERADLRLGQLAEREAQPGAAWPGASAASM